MSPQRRHQVRNLWDLNISELHDHISRGHRNSWWTWACVIAEGTSFFADATVSSVKDNIWPTKRREALHQTSLCEDQHFHREGLACVRISTLQTKSSKHAISWIDSFFVFLKQESPQEAVGMLTSTLCECLRP